MKTFNVIKKIIVTLFTIGFLTACSSTSFQVDKRWSNSRVLGDSTCSSFEFEDVYDLIKIYYLADKAEKFATGTGETQVLKHYMLAASLINKANICIASALEITEALDDLYAERDTLLIGTSIDEAQLVSHRERSTRASARIREKIAEVDKLEPQQKVNLAIGISTFIGGTYTASETFKDLSSLTKSTVEQGKNTVELVERGLEATTQVYENLIGIFGKGSVITFVANGLPDVGKNWTKTAISLKAFTERTQLDIPDDATALFDKIEEDSFSTEEQNASNAG